jgi:cell division protein FtsQ
MKIFNWTNIRLVLMFALVIFLYSFTSKRNAQRKLIKSEVVFVGNSNLFVKNEMVNKLLIENNESVQSITKDKLDLNKLEKSINKHAMIQTAEVFVSVDGVLKAVVKQKTPIGRVFDVSGSYYIDSEGEKMPLSDNYTERVPLISGDLNAVKSEKLTSVLMAINENDFLKKNIIGINISSKGSLNMQNRNCDFEIDFGRTINIERKFKNYMAFFQKAVEDNMLDNYRIINLKFTKQVVCIK